MLAGVNGSGRVAVGLALVLVGACGRLDFDAKDLVDATGDSPLERPVCDRVSGALRCEDFEDGGLSERYDVLGGERVLGAGYLGSTGYRFVAAPGELPLLRFLVEPGLVDGALHVAGRMRIDGVTAFDDFLVLVQATAPDFTKVSFDLNTRNRTQLTNFIDRADAIQGDTGSFPRDRWVCFELRIAIAEAAAGGAIDLRLDDTLGLAGWSDDDTRPDGGFTRIDIGALSSSRNVMPATVTFDDWIIAREPIGCP